MLIYAMRVPKRVSAFWTALGAVVGLAVSVFPLFGIVRWLAFALGALCAIAFLVAAVNEDREKPKVRAMLVTRFARVVKPIGKDARDARDYAREAANNTRTLLGHKTKPKLSADERERLRKIEQEFAFLLQRMKGVLIADVIPASVPPQDEEQWMNAAIDVEQEVHRFWMKHGITPTEPYLHRLSRTGIGPAGEPDGPARGNHSPRFCVMYAQLHRTYEILVEIHAGMVEDRGQ